MFKIIKNFNWIILSSFLCIFMGIVTFLTFINEGFSKLTVLNPKYAAAEKLKNYVLSEQSINSVLKNCFSINFLTPYIIPEQEIITLNKLLTPISTETSRALINAQIVPELLDD